MTRRHSRSNGLLDPVPVLEKLWPGREGIVAELRNVRPNTPHYHALLMCLSAIDLAAEFFTGHSYYDLNPNPDQIGGTSGAMAHLSNGPRRKPAVRGIRWRPADGAARWRTWTRAPVS